jgi:ATP-dependent DNA ligase
VHEIKHDGFRVIARKDGARVKLYSRPGNDLTYRGSDWPRAIVCARPAGDSVATLTMSVALANL